MKLINLLSSTHLSVFFVPRTNPKKAALLVFSAALLLMVGAVTVRGQSLFDGFDPNANAAIHAVVVQPDGKILIGGDFTTVLGVARNHIARLNADGTLDLFNPGADGAVFAIALQPDGAILVGGGFTTIAGQTRHRIARLNGISGIADSFDPDANGIVRTIAVQPNGKVLAGGLFTAIGGQTRNRIARLNAVLGAADLTFDPDANDVVRVITLQPDGKILVGGQFLGANSIGGKLRNYMARLDTNGVADSFNPNANEVVRAIAVQADGNILVGGIFSGANSIGGKTRNHIARLNPTTGTADSFNPNANGDILVITLQTDGKILAGGDFLGANSIGGQTRNRIARLDPATGLADPFDPNANDTVRAIGQQPDGKIVAGGVFTALAPSGGASVTRNNIARLETDGRLDQSLDLNLSSGNVVAIAVQPDGKFLIGGVFGGVLGVTRNNIARVNTDGTLDTVFNPNANNAILAMALQPDGKILVGGIFTSIGGQLRNNIARLDATTGLADLSFDPNVNSVVNAIAVQADGKILVGGSFTTIGGQTRKNIARLNDITGLADSFNPSASRDVLSIAVQADGKILAGGSFTNIGGQTRNRIARLNATTGLADSFDPNATNDVYAIVVQPDGKILVGGIFSGANSIGGQTRNHIARLNAVFGAADVSFDPNANDEVISLALQADGKILVAGKFSGANSIGGQTRNRVARLDGTTGLADSFDIRPSNEMQSLAIQADGKILIGGVFPNINGVPRVAFARVSNEIAALQELTVTQTNITWTLSGSSPQPARVTFESSTDNVNFSLLGSGTPSGNSWTHSSSSLPGGVNLYIRARGYCRNGALNGSESITESVRNMVLPPQPFLTIQRTASTNIVLSWPTNFTGYTLEASTNLSTNVWTDVLAQPVVSGTNNAVTNGTAAPARFYRLRN